MKSYADGILIVVLIEILNDYLFYLVLAGNSEPFSVNVRVRVETAYAVTVNTCLFCWNCAQFGGSVKYLFSVCPVISCCSCVVLNNYITVQLQ